MSIFIPKVKNYYYKHVKKLPLPVCLCFHFIKKLCTEIFFFIHSYLAERMWKCLAGYFILLYTR